MCGAIAAPIMGMVGSVMQGIGAQREAKAQAQAYESQAQAAEANAKAQATLAEDAAARGRQEASDYRTDAKQQQAAQRVAAGASGLDTNSGSASLLYNDAQNTTDDNISRILSNAAREKAGYDSSYASYKTQSNSHKSMAGQARKAGKWGMFSGLLGAATTAASYDWKNKKFY